MARCASPARVQRAERFCLHHLFPLLVYAIAHEEGHSVTWHERFPPAGRGRGRRSAPALP